MAPYKTQALFNHTPEFSNSRMPFGSWYLCSAPELPHKPRILQDPKTANDCRGEGLFKRGWRATTTKQNAKSSHSGIWSYSSGAGGVIFVQQRHTFLLHQLTNGKDRNIYNHNKVLSSHGSPHMPALLEATHPTGLLTTPGSLTTVTQESSMQTI